MKTKVLLAIGALLVLGVSSCSKYKYETVAGDMMQTRIYTLDNGLKVYLSVNKERAAYPDIYRCAYGFEERPCRDHRTGSLSGAPDV